VPKEKLNLALALLNKHSDLSYPHDGAVKKLIERELDGRGNRGL